MTQVDKMPNGPMDAVTKHAIFDATAVTKKAVVAGAIGGLAVAASGGDKKALRDGFLYSGGAVLVRGIYETTTWHRIDGRASEGEPYAMQSFPEGEAPQGENAAPPELAPPRDAYVRDAAGKIKVDARGNPLVDVRNTKAIRPHVGTWFKAGNVGITSEGSIPMIAVSKIPGMNAMALFHDQFCAYFHTGALTTVGTIPPAVLFTYIGTGTQTYDLIQKTAVKNTPNNESWEPKPGYVWSQPKSPNNLSIQWIPGTINSENPHVIAAAVEGTWAPEVGYDWVNPTNSQDLTVRWKAGDQDLAKHLVASKAEGGWEPADGYTWANPNDPIDLTVRPATPAAAKVR